MTRLELERRRRNLTQVALAYHAFVTPSEISLIERRRIRPTDDRLERLSCALGVPADELLDEVTADGVPVPEEAQWQMAAL